MARYALLIGVSEFADQRLARLNAPTNDVIAYDLLGMGRSTAEYYQIVLDAHDRRTFCYRCTGDPYIADKSLDAFLGLDPDVTIPCLSSVPKGTKVGTFDVGGSIKEIQAGRMLFAIDQQQYLQGYLPMVFAVLFVTNLNTVGNGQPVLTGPGIINKANAAKVAALAAKGTR